MNFRKLRLIVSVLCAISGIGCGDGLSPSAPSIVATSSSAAAPSSGPPFSLAQQPSVVAVGETVRSIVASGDPHCTTTDPNVEDLDAPCKTFQTIAPRGGTLVADLTWDNKDIFMELLTPSLGRCCTSALMLEFPVTAGLAYTLAVGFHGITGGGPMATAPFQLTISLRD
jgi:hypothetical protein